MKDQEEKKKRTPKRKEKRKKSSLPASGLVETDGSPYTAKPYKIPGGVEEREPQVRKRNPSVYGGSQQLKNQNGVFVDTLFPSEHLVAMSIKTVEQENRTYTPDEQINIHDHMALDAGPNDYELAMKHQILVVDPDTKDKVATKCISTRENGVFVGPSGEEPKPTDPYVLSRCLIQKRFGSGVLLLRPMEMKPTQLVTRGDLIFQLWYGRVSVTIHETTTVIVSGDFFFIPKGNTYSVRNLRNEEAKFSYTVVKELDAEGEAEDKAKMEKKEREGSATDPALTRQGTFTTEPSGLVSPRDPQGTHETPSRNTGVITSQNTPVPMNSNTPMMRTPTQSEQAITARSEGGSRLEGSQKRSINNTEQ